MSTAIKLSRCCTCGFQWPTGTNGSHSCSGTLEMKLYRVTWLLGQIISTLPENRDWLNPEIEKEARAFLPDTGVESPQ